MSAVAAIPENAQPIATIRQPRRVCLVTEAAGGGVGRHFLDLASGLATRGVEVAAIYSPGRSDASFRARRDATHDVRFIELPMRRAIHPLDALDLKRLVGRIRDEGPFDVIHGHSSKGGALARLAARWLGVPSVYTPHAFVTLDPALSSLKRRMYGAIERWLACRSAAVITVSDDEAAHAQSLGIDPRRIHIVHNGIEPPGFPPRDAVRSRLNLSPDDFVIGFVGRFVSQKAPDVVVEALALLARKLCHARLVMVGDGPLVPVIRRRIAELGLVAKVRLLGDAVATEWMPAFDVFCLPSRYEGLPYVLLEALAAGLPIVANRVGGVAACVESGVNGLILESNEPIELATALATIAGDSELRQRYAAASAAKMSRFSLSQMVNQTLGVYEQVFATA